MPLSLSRRDAHALAARARAAWDALRTRASLHRGLLLVAPVFWASFTVFVHPGWGIAGFLIHAGLCLPRRARGIAPLCAAFPLLALWFAAREPCLTLPGAPLHRPFTADTMTVTRTGVVTGIPVPGARGHTFSFRERGGQGLEYRVTFAGDAPAWGAALALTGRARPAEPAPNPGQLDMRRVLRAQGAAALLEATGWRERDPPPAWKRALLRARDTLGASLTRNVPHPALPLLEASLLNRVENVPEETRRAFTRSGMQHVLAISGQHIGLLAAFVLLAAACARLPRKAAWMAAAALAAAYVPLVGSPVSAARSGIVMACLLPAILRERPPAALHALCLTAAIDLLIDPHNILNLGFQLSYAATLALVLGARPAARAARTALPARGRATGAARGAAQMILLSALIGLFTLPVLAASTHAIAPWGILGNVATVPVGAAMLACGFATWCFDLLLPASFNAVARAAGAGAGLGALVLEGLVFRLAELPGALRPLPDAGSGWIAALAAGCAITAALARTGRLRAAGLCALLLAASEWTRPALARPGDGEARATFLAVGHGDAAVLELPGAVVVVDAGDSPRVARNVILPFLMHRGIARIDRLLITHPDRDHYGGAAALIDGVRVGAIVGPAPDAETSATWRCLTASSRARGIPWHEGRAGDRIHAGRGASLRLLSPGASLANAGKNDRSLVTLLDAGGSRVLLTGDVEQPGQRALSESRVLWRRAWLKAPHHGSDRTTAPCFLREAAPPRAVISCGGRRGFPGVRTLERLEALGTEVSVTARDGAITWELGRRHPGGGRETRHLAKIPPN